jgi:hypothetical protein
LKRANETTEETATKFWKVDLPTGESAYLPDDIKLEFPEDTNVSAERLHLLAYIPWDDKYLQRIPSEYRGFFRSILPYLGARTTNVHTATCLSYVGRLLDEVDPRADRRVVHVALAMHDSGWSRVSPEEIADSLDYSGLADKGEVDIAKGPKHKHDVYGFEISREVLKTNEYVKDLSRQQKEYISILIRNHTEPWKYTVDGEVPVELKLIADADRLWSYTHENFWQDTVRKHVDPEVYLENVGKAIAGYFLTEPAKAIAREFLEVRRAELANLKQQLLTLVK